MMYAMRPKVTAEPAGCLRCAKWPENRAFPGLAVVVPVRLRDLRAAAILDGGRTSLRHSRPKILTRGPDLAARSSVRFLDNDRTSRPRSRPKSAWLIRALGKGRAVRFWTGAVLHSACGVQNLAPCFLDLGRTSFHSSSEPARTRTVLCIRAGRDSSTTPKAHSTPSQGPFMTQASAYTLSSPSAVGESSAADWSPVAVNHQNHREKPPQAF